VIIGLTGGIASGKSTVAKMLVARGALLVDADQIAREVVQPGSPVLAQVAQRFRLQYDCDVLQADGALDRKRLGALVFADPIAKKTLEALIHPPIRATILERMQTLQNAQPERLIVVDIPLLFESNYTYMFDEVMLVYVPRAEQLRRLIARDGLSLEHAEQRLAAQMPIDDKRTLATVIIDNSGDTTTTERQIEQFWRSKGLHGAET
jgi:dephospho-CoA kinase